MFPDNSQLSCTPIGTFYTQCRDKFLMPRQPGLEIGTSGKIVLEPESNMIQALEDLEGFDKLWLLFWFHRNEGWKPKVMPPRGDVKRGLFATRSPHRPNPIGLSCVTLTKIDKLTVYIEDHDLLDGTPILDIKPYLAYSDSYPNAKQGWLSHLKEESPLPLIWDPLAYAQASWLQSRHYPGMVSSLERLISKDPFPKNSNRVRQLDEHHYEKAFKTWRFYYSILENEVRIAKLMSGYDEATLRGEKDSRWDDLAIHLEFLQQKW